MNFILILFKSVGKILKIIPPVYRWIEKRLYPLNDELITIVCDCPGLSYRENKIPVFIINFDTKNNTQYDLIIEYIRIGIQAFQNEIFNISRPWYITLKKGSNFRFYFSETITNEIYSTLETHINTDNRKHINASVQFFITYKYGKEVIRKNVVLSL